MDERYDINKNTTTYYDLISYNWEFAAYLIFIKQDRTPADRFGKQQFNDSMSYDL